MSGPSPKFNFNDISWQIDKVKITADAEDDTYAVLDAKAVWVRWGADKKPAKQRVTQPGEHHPERHELPDNDEDEWPLGLDGDPEDPWKDNRYVSLINTVTAAELTFVTDTYGGRSAVSDLKKQISTMRRAHPGAIPIVKLSNTLMPTRFGQKQRPELKVVGWRGGPALAELAPADEPKQQVQRYSPDRIETSPQRMKSEEPPHTRDPDSIATKTGNFLSEWQIRPRRTQRRGLLHGVDNV